MGDMHNYKCRACGAPLAFDEESQKLRCDFCGSMYDLSEFESVTETGDPGSQDQQCQWGQEGMKYYSCPSCGAELMCDQTTAATQCPYCGNNAVMPGQFSAGQQPEFVIPFKISKKKAVEALKNHYKGKILLPNAFKNENHIKEIQGVYVPFWLFDKDAQGEMSFDGANSSSYREGDYIVTNTMHYRIRRAGDIQFQKVPVDASSKMPDDYMDSIEPFDYQELKPFSTVYMPGFLADKYDVEQSDAEPRARQRCENSMETALRHTVTGYEMIAQTGKDVRLQDRDCHYALLPVWTLATKWRNQTYLFAINGQTGKLVGNLPVDQGKFQRIFWGITVGLGAVLSLCFSGMLGTWFANLF